MAARELVVITGCSSGIGMETAILLSERFHVLAGVRSKGDAEKLRALGKPNLEPVMLDVTKAPHREAVAARVASLSSGKGLWALVNNAGIVPVGPVELLGAESLRQALETNLLGGFELLQLLLPHLRARRGRVVNVGSVVTTMPYPFSAPYVASKRALQSVTHALSTELSAWDVAVTYLEPGNIKTGVWDKLRTSGTAVFDSGPEVLSRTYRNAYDRGRNLSDWLERAGSSPSVVARAIENLMLQRKPPVRLRVGWDARFLWPLLGALPPGAHVWLWRRLLRLRS